MNHRSRAANGCFFTRRRLLETEDAYWAPNIRRPALTPRHEAFVRLGRKPSTLRSGPSIARVAQRSDTFEVSTNLKCQRRRRLKIEDRTKRCDGQNALN